MILLPNKEYSQRLLDELNCIGYRFLESATEYLIDEDDEEYLAQELEWFFPEHLVNQDMQRCLDTLKKKRKNCAKRSIARLAMSGFRRWKNR